MEEETKEIKDLKEIETTPPDEIATIEVINNEEEQAEEVEKTEENPKSNKKLFMTIGIISCVILILLIILIVVLIRKNKSVKVDNVSDKSAFVITMENALEDESLVTEINKGLKNLSIKTDNVKLLYIDIDSDSKNEVVAYAEEGTNKGLIQLEINDDVYFEDAYPMDSIDSLGYAYNSLKNTNTWYVIKDKNYTLISSAKKIIKEEDFLNSFYVLANTYKDKAILENSITYNLDKELNVKSLEKKSFSNDELLEDNDLDSSNIKDTYNKYLQDKKEKEEKEKAEALEKEKEEKEKQKLEGRLQLGNVSYHFGTYNILSKNGSNEGTLIIYSDNTCVHKGINCTYSIETMTPSDDIMIPIISLSTGHVYKPSSVEGELTDLEENVTVKYAS